MMNDENTDIRATIVPCFHEGLHTSARPQKHSKATLFCLDISLLCLGVLHALMIPHHPIFSLT
ncbi:hypothetical protein GE21DRAFT_1027990 [Neurospora crassa]|nr:hypothetical protein GE21DRAFT_1027990 [Neurospora crassa]